MVKNLKYILFAIPLFAIASWEMDFDEDYSSTSIGTVVNTISLWYKLNDNSATTVILDSVLASSSFANVVPTMTSATAPSGVVTASAEINTSYAAWKAFRNQETTDAFGWATAWAGNPHWLQYAFPSAKTIVQYSIRQRSEGIYPRAPKSWTLQASTNGNFSGEQATLDTQTNITDWASSENVKKTYTLTNTTAYTYYRLVFTASNDASYIGVGTVMYYETSSGETPANSAVASANTSTMSTNGIIGTALNFSNGQYADCDAFAYAQQNISISLWFNLNVTGYAQFRTMVSQRRATAAFEVGVAQTSGALYFYTGTDYRPSTFIPDQGKWYHAVFTLDSSNTLRFYINGSLVDDELNVLRGASLTGLTLAGNGLDKAQKLYGSLDDIRIFYNVLSPRDVNILYSNGIRGIDR